MGYMKRKGPFNKSIQLSPLGQECLDIISAPSFSSVLAVQPLPPATPPGPPITCTNNNRDIKDQLRILTSSRLYYVGCNNYSNYTQPVGTKDTSFPRSVDVPRWRLDSVLMFEGTVMIPESQHTQTPSTNRQMEKAEEDDETVYLKRHEKHEKEEKRIKKWDLRRRREQFQLQKLRARESSRSAASQSMVAANSSLSLFPDLESVTHICVCLSLDVWAMGRPLPHMQAEDFCLSWL